MIFNSSATSITSGRGSLNFLGDKQIQFQVPLARSDRAAVRRQANDELAALRREELNQRRRELEAAQSMEFAANSPDLSYAPAYGFYGPYVKPRANRPDIHRRAEHHRGVHENRVPAVIRRPHRG